MAIPSNIAKCLEQYFDKILVISVPRFTSRHELAKQNLQGLSFEFLWGTDKLDLDFEQLKANRIYDEKQAKSSQRQGKALSLAEVACALTHRQAYTAMVENGWKRVLIMEDDPYPLEANLSQLPAALSELPEDWELIYFGYWKHEQVTTALRVKQFFYKIISSLGLMAWSYKMVSNLLPMPYSRHLKKAGFHDCAHAYAITLDAAQKLLAAQTPVIYRADDLLSATVLKGELKAFVTEPKFFDQERFHNSVITSEIQA